jgi:hypothetical protein
LGVVVSREWIAYGLSSARFKPYLDRCAGDLGKAERLYWWNVEVSSAFYTPLHCLEDCLRNALHAELAARHERADWWAVAALDDDGKQQVATARNKCGPRRGRIGGADDIVAELSLGFWVSLLGQRYDQEFWRPALHRAFRPGYTGRRDALHKNLDHLRRFRNRIMHHEPVYHRRLEADHQRIYELVGYLVPEMVDRLKVVDRVPAALVLDPRTATDPFQA